MTTRSNVLAGLVVSAVLLGGFDSPAAAQTAAPVIRGDLTGTLAWLAVNKEEAVPYDSSDWHNSLFGAVSAGWYWTDHLKTELDVGGGTKATVYRGRAILIDGRPTYEITESTFSRRMLGISQQYQFFRNAWFHPHVAAGVNIDWERMTDRVEPVVFYDDVARTGRVVRAERTEGPRTQLTVNPFMATGFKAYMTQRAFFRGDLRVAIREGVDDVLLRFGFGVDF